MNLRPKLPISVARIRHTAVFIETLIAIHTKPDANLTAPSHASAVKIAFNEDLIEYRQQDGAIKKSFKLTERGLVYLQMLIDTPLPAVSTTFADPRTL